MKTLLPSVASITLLGALTACGSGGSEPASTTSSTTSSSSSTTATSSSTTTTSSTTSETSSPTVAPEPAAQVATTTAAASIFTTPGNGYRCAGTDAWVWDPANCTGANLGAGPEYDTYYGPGAAIDAQQEQQRLAEIPIADGGTCPAAKCGYGHDANGNPNPTSGEIQLMDACEKGYVDDPEKCAALASKAEQYGWW